MDPVIARMLNLPVTATKRQVLSATDNFSDWLVYKRSLESTMAENLRVMSVATEAMDKLHGQAAMQFALSRKPGQAVVSNWTRTLWHAQKVYNANPTEVLLEAVRATAAFLDPTPWARAKIGKWRFTVGYSSACGTSIRRTTTRWRSVGWSSSVWTSPVPK
jgi:hypothetical protein